jgi:hypothetical protein
MGLGSIASGTVGVGFGLWGLSLPASWECFPLATAEEAQAVAGGLQAASACAAPRHTAPMMRLENSRTAAAAAAAAPAVKR